MLESRVSNRGVDVEVNNFLRIVIPPPKMINQLFMSVLAFEALDPGIRVEMESQNDINSSG